MTTLTDHCFGLNIPLQIKSLFLGVFISLFVGKLNRIPIISASIGLVFVETLILVQDMK